MLRKFESSYCYRLYSYKKYVYFVECYICVSGGGGNLVDLGYGDVPLLRGAFS